MTDIARILSHLPLRKIQELEKVTKRIADTGKAEIIVLFGSYARGDYKEKRGKTQGKRSDYDILVVTSGTDEDALLDITKTVCRERIAYLKEIENNP